MAANNDWFVCLGNHCADLSCFYRCITQHGSALWLGRITGVNWIIVIITTLHSTVSYLNPFMPGATLKPWLFWCDLSASFIINMKNIVQNSTTTSLIQVNLDMTDSMGPGKLVRHMQKYIWRILDMHRTGTKHTVRHLQKSVVQWSVISKFTCSFFPMCRNLVQKLFSRVSWIQAKLFKGISGHELIKSDVVFCMWQGRIDQWIQPTTSLLLAIVFSFCLNPNNPTFSQLEILLYLLTCLYILCIWMMRWGHGLWKPWPFCKYIYLIRPIRVLPGGQIVMAIFLRQKQDLGVCWSFCLYESIFRACVRGKWHFIYRVVLITASVGTLKALSPISFRYASKLWSLL